MSSFYNPFISRSRSGDAWFSAGLTTSYPNITTSSSTLLSDHFPLPCKNTKDFKDSEDIVTVAPGCKVFHVPLSDSSQATQVDLEDTVTPTVLAGLRDQVIVFQYQGEFHAVDHSCPHSSYPLSRGTLFDIEDFGVRLSAGLRCPKHDWSFDLFHGKGDRGSYRLKIWEVQLRPVSRVGSEGEERDIWVRRKQRIG